MGAKYVFNPLTGNLDTTDVVAFNGEVNLGTAAAPSVFFTGDLNTGIYSPGADQVAISTNGTGRLFIDSSGNLGLGTSSPNVQLHCTGDVRFGDAVNLSRNNLTGLVTITDLTLEPFTQGFAFRTNETDEAYRFQNGDGTSTYLTIRGSGNVGIGTASPSETLTLNAATGASLGFEYGGSEVATISNNNAALYVTAGSGKLLSLGADGSEKARIDTSGRLLVGTSTSVNSNALVKVQGQAGNPSGEGQVVIACGTNTPLSDSFIGALLFTDSSGGLGSYVASLRDGGTWSSGASHPSRLVFSVTADGASSPTEAMRIKNSRIINIANTPVYADNAAAKTGGLVDGDVYRTSTGDLKIVYT